MDVHPIAQVYHQGQTSRFNVNEATERISEFFGLNLTATLARPDLDGQFICFGRRSSGVAVGGHRGPACSITNQPPKNCDSGGYVAYTVTHEHWVSKPDGAATHLRPNEAAAIDIEHNWTQKFLCDHSTSLIALDKEVVRQMLPNMNRFKFERKALPAKIARLINDLIQYATSIPAESYESAAPHLASTLLGITALGSQATDAKGSPLYGISAEVRRQQLKAFIEENYALPNLSISMIANRFKVSERHVHRLFADGGQSPSDYLVAKRLNAAQKMLIDTQYSGFAITDIAFACGFNSGSHFSTQFKRYFDRSPRSVRQACLKK